MPLTFIHAADLHVDSPLAALGAKDAVVAERFARAGRSAVTALVDETIRSDAAFLIIAGDLFDGDWKDVSTGLFMVAQLARLARAKIPVFVIKGNHDADSVVSRLVKYPPEVIVFSGRKAETHVMEQAGIAVHGRSFPDRVPPDGFVASYPAPRPGLLNIGILHTALDGTRGDHQHYAPCTVLQLQGFGYDYWALGHIHQSQIIARDPWIVYPGNIQGRSVRETGAKGALRVRVQDGRVVSVEPIVLDGARWAHERIDASACQNADDVTRLAEARMAQVHASAQGRPVALRLTLHGANLRHPRFVSQAETLLESLRQHGLHLADDFWVERLVVSTHLPKARPILPQADALDIAALLDAAQADPEFAIAAAQDIASLAAKLPQVLRQAFLDDAAALQAQLVAEARDLLLGRLDGAEAAP